MAAEVSILPTRRHQIFAVYYFERACETYITALSTGRPLRVAPTEVARRTCRQWTEDYAGSAEFHFKALRQILDKEEPAYAR